MLNNWRKEVIMNKYHFKPFNTAIVILISILTTTHFSKVEAQNKRANKEEINITSSFKPSIVKTGKIEFQPKTLPKDTSPYFFKYPFESSRFTTSLSPFTVKPLAFLQNTHLKGKENFVKIGFGNLQSPLASISFSDVKDKIDQSLAFDHFSASGRLPNQKVSQSSLLGMLKRKYSENQYWNFFFGVDRRAFNLYGYDQTMYNLTKQEISQIFNSIRAGSSYRIVTGNEGQTSLAPELNFDYLSASRKTAEFSTQIKFPLSIVLSSQMFINTQLDFDYVHLNDTATGNRSNYLIKLPSKFSYQNGKFNLGIGLIPLVSKNKASIVPDLKILYAINDAGFRLKAGISNQIVLNSLSRLYKINPFLTTPDSISLFSESNYYVGLDWVNQKALQFNFSIGISQFKNMPLYINTGPTGRQFKVLQEPNLNFFHFKGGLEYLIDENMQFKTEIKYYSTLDQERYNEPFGFLPLELSTNFSWSPMPPVRLGFNASLWRGSMALDFSNTGAGGLQPSFRLKDAADLSLIVDYKLNKKWALWVDLNNIANVRYQRWNKYESFGFNFLAGIKYNFISQ